MTTLLKEMGIAQLSSLNERTLASYGRPLSEIWLFFGRFEGTKILFGH